MHSFLPETGTTHNNNNESESGKMGKATKEKKDKEGPQPQFNKLVQIRDHVLDFPELYLNIYISEQSEEAAFAPMFARAWCNAVADPYDADLVVFTGGPDVNPELYGKEAHPRTVFDKDRDNRDMQLFADCYMAGIPMLGICRGSQFLHVMNAGELYQHVDGHVGDHHITDCANRVTIARVSSTHHQMVKRNNRMQVLATASKSRERWSDPKDKEEGYHDDVEAFFYEETCSLGIQGHPEFYGYTAFSKWTLDQIDKCIVSNPSVYVDGGKYRLKKDVRIERETLDSTDERVIR